jgi:hypothetical protein
MHFMRDAVHATLSVAGRRARATPSELAVYALFAIGVDYDALLLGLHDRIDKMQCMSVHFEDGS